MQSKPSKVPSSPLFGSGPCKKHPEWTLNKLSSAIVGRSHRAPEGVARVQHLLDLTRQLLEIPQDYAIAIVPGSGTGAVETALWNFLGSRPVDVFAWDVFGKLWVTDTVEQLPIDHVRPFVADFGKLPDLNQYDGNHDCIFTWNGTSGGVMIPDLDWIPDDRQGLTICDATSSVFAMPINKWEKLDITSFSWQKGLGGEGAHGMIVVSPRAMQHLSQNQPKWPVPRLLRLTSSGTILTSIFEAKTINTPSLLCIEDFIKALEWGVSVGGAYALWARTQQNYQIINTWVNNHADLKHLASEARTRSIASVCINLSDTYCSTDQHPGKINQIASMLSELGIAHDIKNHFLAPASFRIWCGPTVETNDLKILTQWIDWALDNARLNQLDQAQTG